MTGVPNALLRVGVVVTRLLGTGMLFADESHIVQPGQPVAELTSVS